MATIIKIIIIIFIRIYFSYAKAWGWNLKIKTGKLKFSEYKKGIRRGGKKKKWGNNDAFLRKWKKTSRRNR
jgi:hypothetical protein